MLEIRNTYVHVLSLTCIPTGKSSPKCKIINLFHGGEQARITEHSVAQLLLTCFLKLNIFMLLCLHDEL